MINARKSAQSKSFTIKNSRSAIRSHDKSPNSLSIAQKVILAIIGILALIIVVMTILLLRFDEKYQVEAKISDIARDYYEEYYYPNAFGSDEALAANFLTRYDSTGLAPISLRQMFYSLPDVSEHEQNLIEKYCNKNTTTVTYYPDSPYSKDSYHTEIRYSCEFK